MAGRAPRQGAVRSNVLDSQAEAEGEGDASDTSGLSVTESANGRHDKLQPILANSARSKFIYYLVSTYNLHFCDLFSLSAPSTRSSNVPLTGARSRPQHPPASGLR